MPLRRLVRWAVRVVAGLVVLVVLLFGVTAFRVWHVARRDERGPADVILVLGASQYDGRPSEIFRARLDHAARLYRADVAPRVVTVGGSQVGDRFTEAGSGATYLRANGVARDDVIDVGVGTDTLTSLEAAVAKVLDERGWRHVVLVTDPWHSFRAARMAEDLGLTAETSPARTGPVVQTRAGEFRYIARETAAYLYYRVFDRGLGRGPAAA